MKKKRTFLIPLLLGLALIAVGIFFFGKICRLKDKVYSNYKVSLSDASIAEVFNGDLDENAVREAFNNAVKKTDKNAAAAAAPMDDLAVEAEAAAEEGEAAAEAEDDPHERHDEEGVAARHRGRRAVSDVVEGAAREEGRHHGDGEGIGVILAVADGHHTTAQHDRCFKAKQLTDNLPYNLPVYHTQLGQMPLTR